MPVSSNPPMSAKDTVSVMRESVSTDSVIGEVAKRARLRVSALFMTMCITSLLAVLATSAIGASSAFADGGWWHLSLGARPGVVVPGDGADEVQELVVSATGGECEPIFSGTGCFILTSEEVGHEGFAVLPFDASHEEVQAALEGMYGAGNVSVSGGPGDELGSKPYVIRFTGAFAQKPVHPLTAFSEFFSIKLEGGRHEAKVTERTVGRPDGQVVVTASNLGVGPVDGAALNGKGEPEPVRVVDRLPAGFTAIRAEGIAGAREGSRGFRGPVSCSVLGVREVVCEFAGTLPPFYAIEMIIDVDVSVPSGSPDEASVSGGVTPPAVLRRVLPVGSEPPGFGIEDYELSSEDEGGGLDTQAGSHPFQQTTTIALNQTLEPTEVAHTQVLVPSPVALVKDLNFKWPAGLIGNPTAIPRCSLAQFLHPIIETNTFVANACPPDTVVGVVQNELNLPKPIGKGGSIIRPVVPLFNLEPSRGEPARFGFRVLETPVFIDPSVRSGGDYGITVSVHNIAQTVGFVSSQVTVWGVPGDRSHDNARGWGCLSQAIGEATQLPCNPAEQQNPPAFLSLPTACPTDPGTGGPQPLQTSVEGASWVAPGVFTAPLQGDPMPALDGCNALPFSPEISVSPDNHAASTPAGLRVNVHVPQNGQLNPTGLANSHIKNIEVALPEGMALNPAAADGLQACSESQIGYLPGDSHPPGDLHFTPFLPGSLAASAAGDEQPLQPGRNFCPDAAKVGTARIKTPLLPDPLEGAVFLASPQNFAVFPQENPFESLVAMYIVAEDPISGSLVKLPGRVSLDQGTGRVTGIFENTPQLAFEDAEVEFFGGNRAPLATPSHCGTYTTEATFTPWSGNPPVKSTSSFDITSGPNGSPCQNPLGFAPSLHASSSNIQAGAFTPFTTTMSREDGQQNLQGIQLHMPPGLSGLLPGVKLCGEDQANTGTCGPDSLIGETIVSVGLGGDPFTVTGGKVYLTEKYKGAPFGLSIVNPADAGPFHLGKVIVRAKIEVDPHTAALTVTTDNTGPFKIPQLIDGFPLQIKHVNVTINRPGFTFNPTNCNPLAITGSIISTEGAVSGLSVPFQVTNCATLKFAPKFKVSTSGKTSKAKGASLSVKLTYPKAPFGSQANIARVKVDLPKQLPSRLTTLQKACTAAQFEANPAGCPPASKIGYAKAITPLIPVPLEGPAIFVSHGGEAFPSLIMVLQGYGVTVDLVGTTFISKAGITSSTFKTVPDAPVGSFEVTLPQGKFSALAANGNLCKSASKLKMPTEFVAQNGAKINRSTKINVTGCPKKHKKAKHAKKKTGKHKNKHGKR
jgi:hypothetical protein